ncbi:ABC transporter ATP-binding protein [Halostagnicola kamekurae]|uniref:ABC-2 type transport system ATP-binding protein n=1 Tax=Halostagnicola kamekurae TaxID=619731 RepID=A0A1I6QMH9_9EURY|nr:ABC transporter ATP-binding protein [Halostagnicola kamekurae]SFS53664.1 ABC-2 type transport system ATP-binding protein [Halostagnicola kamekurae]
MVPIEIDGLSKEFPGDVLAVDDLDLRIESGEIFGFLGPNGAGKSTTINVLLGFVDPTAGSVSVLGQDVQGSEFAQTRHRIGVLPEGYSLYDRLSAREHVDWVARTKRADDDPDEILERVGIGDVADRRVGGFSKGMRQRLAFGMALVGDPDLLVLDEPSSGLDPTGMQEMRAIIREEAATGTTVFFSSHVLPEVEAVCDRVGIMNDGRLVAVDEIETLRDEITSSSRITLAVRSVPDELGLETLDGVTNVQVDGSEIHVDCRATTVKPRVVRYVDDRATITDIVSEEPSLEELFNRYTGDADAPDEEAPSPAEVTA